MGIIQKGILGGFSGKVGNVIGGNWKGIDYMRSQAQRSDFVPTQKQIEQQLKFALIARFQQPLSNLFAVSFKNYAIKKTGGNAAMSYNLKNAITGTYPAFTVDFENALVSRGDMPNALNPSAVAAAAGIVNFSWDNNSGSGKALDTDHSILVAYCPEMRSAIYQNAGPARSLEAASLDLSTFSGKEVQTWLGFVSVSGKEVATSAFTGAVTVL